MSHGVLVCLPPHAGIKLYCFITEVNVHDRLAKVRSRVRTCWELNLRSPDHNYSITMPAGHTHPDLWASLYTGGRPLNRN